MRQNRFSERIKNKNDKHSILKSKLYVEETVDYIYRSILYFDKKIKNPLYLVWSNDFIGLEKYFDSQKFVFVRNYDDKVLTDFYLLTKCQIYDQESLFLPYQLYLLHVVLMMEIL